VLTGNSNTRIFLCTQDTDMRKSFDSLRGIIRGAMHLDPLSGSLFVFKNKRGDRIKCIYWDETGFAMWYKVLQRGTFQFPSLEKLSSAGLEIDGDTRCRTTEALLYAQQSGTENYAGAIRLLLESLEVLDQQKDPMTLASVHKELGNAKLRLYQVTEKIKIDLGSAWNDFMLAASVYTRDAAPRQWTEIQNNLATIELFGDKPQGWESAAKRLEGARRVCQSLGDPYLLLYLTANLFFAYNRLFEVSGNPQIGRMALSYREQAEALRNQLGIPE
jgi:IS66 Orf2 like protein